MVTGYFFLLFIIYYKWLTIKTIKKAIGDNYSIEDITIEVGGFPPFISKTQIIDQFSIFGEVAEVHTAKIYEGKLSAYKEIYEKAYTAEVNSKIHKKNVSFDKIIPLKTYNDKFTLSNTYDELQIGKVFITFNQIESKKKCLQNYKNTKSTCCKKKMRNTRRSLHFRLIIESAANPSDIL